MFLKLMKKLKMIMIMTIKINIIKETKADPFYRVSLLPMVLLSCNQVSFRKSLFHRRLNGRNCRFYRRTLFYVKKFLW